MSNDSLRVVKYIPPQPHELYDIRGLTDDEFITLCKALEGESAFASKYSPACRALLEKLQKNVERA